MNYPRLWISILIEQLMKLKKLAAKPTRESPVVQKKCQQNEGNSFGWLNVTQGKAVVWLKKVKSNDKNAGTGNLQNNGRDDNVPKDCALCFHVTGVSPR